MRRHFFFPLGNASGRSVLIRGLNTHNYDEVREVAKYYERRPFESNITLLHKFFFFFFFFFFLAHLKQIK